MSRNDCRCLPIVVSIIVVLTQVLPSGFGQAPIQPGEPAIHVFLQLRHSHPKASKHTIVEMRRACQPSSARNCA